MPTKRAFGRLPRKPCRTKVTNRTRPKYASVVSRSSVHAECCHRRAGADAGVWGLRSPEGTFRRQPVSVTVLVRLCSPDLCRSTITYSPGQLQFVTTSSNRRAPLFLSGSTCNTTRSSAAWSVPQGTGRGQVGGFTPCRTRQSCAWTGWVEPGSKRSLREIADPRRHGSAPGLRRFEI